MGGGAILGIDQEDGLAFRDISLASLSGSFVKTGMDGALKNGRTIGRPSMAMRRHMRFML